MTFAGSNPCPARQHGLCGADHRRNSGARCADGPHRRDRAAWLGKDSNLQMSFWKMPFEMSGGFSLIPKHLGTRDFSRTSCHRTLLESFGKVDYPPLYGGRVPRQSMFPAPETGSASRSSFTKVVVVPKAPPCLTQGCR